MQKKLDKNVEKDFDYSGGYSEYAATGEGLASTASLAADGRISVSFNLKKILPDLPPDYAQDVQESAVDHEASHIVPRMAIVIMIVGSRGDVQPFLALGKRLVQDGHSVRVATHETFREFVKDAGLQFYNIGGNPQDLMSYMVKNPGLIPGFESLTNGDIGRKRKMLTEMMEGCWRACYAGNEETGETFSADAIISNPPAFGHIHCAEALGIPLLLSFTMPWSPTISFPHPLVNIKQSNASQGLTNYLSYALTDLITWQGLGDIINKFRQGTLGLHRLDIRSGPGVVDRLKIPWTYCMSPALVPKPTDWKNHIDVVGFYFLETATNYQPPAELVAFLNAGPPPVYIGFGSVVVDDPVGMTRTILEAVKKAGVRALVSAGWGGLGGSTVPPSVFILGNVPHDWLFTKVAAVCHHGGAGTTAIGLRLGKPTIIVPFFGDQPFWGAMVHNAGAGPEPIPHKSLGVDNLAEAIRFAMSPSAQAAAVRLGEQIRSEDGVAEGVKSFYRHLPLLNMRCDLDPTRLAVWWSTEHCLKLSGFAAQTLADSKQLDMLKLDLHRSKEYETRRAVNDPVTGGVGAIFWTITHWYGGIAQIFYNPVQGVIKTTTAIPQGVIKIVSSIHEGFYNAPKLYGSDVRQPGKVDGFVSGVQEAGKGLFYGYYDGITGLVREPIKGAKEEGFLGFIKGSGRSYINATIRPAGGIVGAVAHPALGAWKSMQKTFQKGSGAEFKQRPSRLADGLRAVRNSTRAERDVVLQKFQHAKASTQERKKRYVVAAEEVLAENIKVEWETPTPGTSPQTPLEEPGALQSSSSRSTRSDLPDDDEAAFQHDMERAMQLSLSDTGGTTSL